MIRDPELREVFQAETGERLQRMDEGLLRLEREPGNESLLRDLFREAHSLKGSARLLGEDKLERVAHAFEDLLGLASKGEFAVSAETFDVLSEGVSAMEKLVVEALEDKPAGVDVETLVARIQALAADEPAPEETAPEETTPEERPATLERPPTEAAARSGAPSSEDDLFDDFPPDPRAKPAVLHEQAAEAAPKPAARLDQPPPSVSECDEPLPISPEPSRKSAASPEFGEKADEEWPPRKSSAPKAATPPADRTPAPDKAPPKKAPTESKSPAQDDEAGYRVDTIRVEPRKLDRLMNQVGELAVIRTRLRQRLTDVEELLSSWEDWSREVSRLSHAESAEERLRVQSEAFQQLGRSVGTLQQAIYEDASGLEFVARELEEGVRNLRLLPLSSLFSLFPRMVRDLCRTLDREAELVIHGADTSVDKHVLEEMKSPLTHMIRNAVHHGLESPKIRESLGKPRQGVVSMSAMRTATHVVIQVADDGAGLDTERIREKAVAARLIREEEARTLPADRIHQFIFHSGLSTSGMITDISGRGVGMDVVLNQVNKLKGSIDVSSQRGQGTCFTIHLPVSLTTAQVFIVRAAGELYAIPLEHVSQVFQLKKDQVYAMEGRPTITLDRGPVSVTPLAQLLGRPQAAQAERERLLRGEIRRPCLVLSHGEDRLGLLVDELEDELEVVLKPHGNLLRTVQNVSGATILGTGQVCMILDPLGLLRTAHGMGAPAPMPREGEDAPAVVATRRILLAEDSITTRTQMKRILEAAGFEVVTAVDGLDGWNKLASANVDAVVSDVEMPNMTGLQFAERIRQEDAYKALPVILVTSLSSDDDRRRGMEVGASAYITKPAFDQSVFLDTLRRLV